MDGVALIEYLNKIGGENGIGQLDIVENRLVGMKARGVYETPGGTILYAAHAKLEEICLDKDTLHYKQNVANAQRTYDLNLTRYREGDITGMDMNQFQTQLSNKKIAYTQALINYKIELLNLKILSLYDFEHDVPIVPMEDLVTKK